MGQRKRKQRKQYSCGHSGSCQLCHQCTQVVHIDETLPPTKAKSAPSPKSSLRSHHTWAVTAPNLAKQQWKDSFAHDSIDLRHLPKPVVIKTRHILTQLAQGIPPSQLQGKRLSFDRTLLRIPVTYRYRLLCRWYTDRIVPLQVLSHEAYNAIARNKKRMNG